MSSNTVGKRHRIRSNSRVINATFCFVLKLVRVRFYFSILMSTAIALSCALSLASPLPSVTLSLLWLSFHPTRTSLDDQGNLHVVDETNHRIVCFQVGAHQNSGVLRWCNCLHRQETQNEHTYLYFQDKLSLDVDSAHISDSVPTTKSRSDSTAVCVLRSP